jgi:hypothetical protein
VRAPHDQSLVTKLGGSPIADQEGDIGVGLHETPAEVAADGTGCPGSEFS